MIYIKSVGVAHFKTPSNLPRQQGGLLRQLAERMPAHMPASPQPSPPGEGVSTH